MNSRKNLAGIAILSSLSALLMLWQIPYPGASFLQLDISQVPVLIAGFVFGPWSGVAVLVIKNLLFLLIKFSPHEFLGIPMNVISQGIFVLAAAGIYSRKKTWHNAVTGLFSGVTTSTLAMIPANYFVLPLFMRWFAPDIPIPGGETLIHLIVTVIIPFNILNGGLNGLLTFFVYKRVSKLLRCESVLLPNPSPQPQPEEMKS